MCSVNHAHRSCESRQHYCANVQCYCTLVQYFRSSCKICAKYQDRILQDLSHAPCHRGRLARIMPSGALPRSVHLQNSCQVWWVWQTPATPPRPVHYPTPTHDIRVLAQVMHVTTYGQCMYLIHGGQVSCRHRCHTYIKYIEVNNECYA